MFVNVVTFGVLPCVAIVAINCVAIVLIIPTYAFDSVIFDLFTLVIYKISERCSLEDGSTNRLRGVRMEGRGICHTMEPRTLGL